MIRYPDERRVKVSFVLDELVFINSRTKVYSARVYNANKNEYLPVMVKHIEDKTIATHEINNWKHLYHPNIVKLYFSCEFQQATLLFMESGRPLT
jgi:hypothetical protein